MSGSRVGGRIRQRRLALGLTMRGLAGPGVSAGYIARVENGQRRPSVEALRVLTGRLGVSSHWLETGSEDPAIELAELVLDHRGEVLPRQATALARNIIAGKPRPR